MQALIKPPRVNWFFNEAIFENNSKRINLLHHAGRRHGQAIWLRPDLHQAEQPVRRRPSARGRRSRAQPPSGKPEAEPETGSEAGPGPEVEPRVERGRVRSGHPGPEVVRAPAEEQNLKGRWFSSGQSLLIQLMCFFTTSSQTAFLYLQQMALLGYFPTTLCCGVITEMTCLWASLEPTSVELHQTGTFEGRPTN